jgi:hypothetical protein
MATRLGLGVRLGPAGPAVICRGGLEPLGRMKTEMKSEICSLDAVAGQSRALQDGLSIGPRQNGNSSVFMIIRAKVIGARSARLSHSRQASTQSSSPLRWLRRLKIGETRQQFTARVDAPYHVNDCNRPPTSSTCPSRMIMLMFNAALRLEV